MNIFSRNFDVVTEEDEKIMEEYFHGFDYRGAGYTFLANYIWRTTQCLCWEVIDGYLCIAGADCIVGEPSAIVSMPLTKDGTYNPEKLRTAVLVRGSGYEETVRREEDSVQNDSRSGTHEKIPGGGVSWAG